MSTTIRVSTDTRDRIAMLAGASGEPMNAVVDQALDALERRRFFDDLNTRYGELRQDEQAWSDIERERAGEATSLHDISR